MPEKSIVVIFHGKNYGERIEELSVCAFENGERYGRGRTTARNFCRIINSLKLADDGWIFARIVMENEVIPLAKPDALRAMINLDNFGFTKEITLEDLACILYNADEHSLKRVCEIFPKEDATRLCQESEIAPSPSAIDEAQKRVFDIIHKNMRC